MACKLKRVRKGRHGAEVAGKSNARVLRGLVCNEPSARNLKCGKFTLMFTIFGGDRDETETETRQRQRQRPREVYIHRPRYKVTHTYTTHKHTNTHTHTHNTHDPKKTEEEEEHPPAIALPAAFVPRPRDMGVAAHLVSAGLMT